MNEDDDTPPGYLLFLAVFMVVAMAWQTLAYKGHPDAAGHTFDQCLVEFAGFAWGCPAT